MISELYCQKNELKNRTSESVSSFSTKKDSHISNKDLEDALNFAEQAYEAARESHQEAVDPLLLLCKVNYFLRNENEFLRVNEILHSLVKFFHEGRSHPILLKIFKSLGDLFYQAGFFQTVLSYFNEAYLLSKTHLGYSHKNGL